MGLMLGRGLYRGESGEGEMSLGVLLLLLLMMNDLTVSGWLSWAAWGLGMCRMVRTG